MSFEKLIIDPEENMELFDVMLHRRRHKFQEVYGKMYEIEYSQLALDLMKRMKLDKLKEKYRNSHPKKEKKQHELSYYQRQKLKELKQKQEDVNGSP
jgi:hypothetical protein